MTKMEEHLEGLFDIFDQHTRQLGHVDFLTQDEIKQLIPKELPNVIKNIKDKNVIDKLFKDLDEAEQQKEITFAVAVKLLSTLLVLSHEANRRS